MAHSTDSFVIIFQANEPAVVTIHGDGDTDLDLFIHDENGNLITSDTRVTDQEAAQPTRANSETAFEQLTERAGPGDQVVILLAGHGTQLPIPEEQEDPFDPDNFEPDGMDEYFLPADVGNWTKDGFPSAIRDNTIGDWLDGLRDKGASVWAIFDACHSGTMSRSVDLEWNRSVTASELGVPAELLDDAARKVREALARRPDQPPVRLGEAGGRGALITFYAAQPDEPTPELPLPRGKPRTAEHIYGQFSYALCQILKQTEGTLTYRDLARRMVSMYRAERGSRPPTPLFDGDLDRDVLGADLGPRIPIYLDQTDGELRLSAGALIGLTPGTILAVHPPGGSGREDDEAVGHVRVTAVTPTGAEVVSVGYADREASPAAELPDAARCRIVVQDVGDMEVTVALEGENVSPVRFARLKEAFAALPAGGAQLVRVVDDVAEAEWVLRLVSPEAAQAQFGMAIEQPTVLLLPGSGRKETAPPAATPRVFGQYGADDVDGLASALRNDLHKIFAWRNVWRVANSLEESRSVGAGDIEFQVLRLDDEAAGGADPESASPAGHRLYPGERVQLRLANRGLVHDRLIREIGGRCYMAWRPEKSASGKRRAKFSPRANIEHGFRMRSNCWRASS